MKNQQQGKQQANLSANIRKFETLRGIAEKLVDNKGVEESSVSQGEFEDLLHELQVYQAELELQNEELRNLQSKIEQSRNKYYELFNFAPVGYIIIDEAYNIKEINTTALEQLGRTLDESRHKPILSFIRPFNHDKMVSFLRIISMSDECHEIIVELHVDNGGKSKLVKIDAVRTERGNDGGRAHLLVLTDLTELYRAQQAVMESETIHRALIHSSTDHIFLLDRDGRYLMSNDNVAHLGFSSGKELVGKQIDEVYPEEIQAEYRQNFEHVLQTAEPAVFSHELFQNGDHFFHHDRLYPIVSNGEIWAVGGICRDVTAETETKNRNQQLEIELRQKQKIESLGTLSGGIAHDFNNILASVLGFTELALNEVEKGSTLEHDLKEVYQAGVRAKNLVAQILTYARKSAEERVPLRLNSAVNEVLGLIRHSLPTTITIDCRLSSKRSVMANSTQIHQVLMNLCTNSLHAITSGNGVLTIKLTDIDLGERSVKGVNNQISGECVLLTVMDNGEGIPKEILHKVLDPYFTTKEMGTGTGMGLSVVQGIVEGHGGVITLESVVGEGTTVNIYFPMAREDESAEKAVYSKEVELGGSERILIVDDEEKITKVFHRILENSGYSVTVFTSSKKALVTFEQDPYAFDLVISDVTMPEMDGEKITREILKIRSDMPVVLCSGYSSYVDEKRALQIGARGFLTKPLDKSALLKFLRHILDAEKRE